MIFVNEKITLILVVALWGIAILNVIMSYVAIESSNVLKKEPEINRGIFSEIDKEKKRSDKYSWAVPEIFSVIMVRVVFVIYLIGVLIIYFGLHLTGQVQALWVVTGICTLIFSLGLNFSVGILAFSVVTRMRKEQWIFDHPEEAEKERLSESKNKKYFGISFKI